MSNFDKIPTSEHWAIIEKRTVHIPGDERSQTNPGHGYPESTEETLSYRPFTNFAEFTEEMRKVALVNQYRNVIGIHVDGVFGVTPTVQIFQH